MRGLQLLYASAVAVLVAACGSSIDSDSGEGSREAKADVRLTVAVVPKLTTIDFYDQVRQGAECAAKRAGKVEIDWDGTSGFDINAQVDLLQNTLTVGADALVYAASDSKALYPITRQARTKNLPVANFDSGTSPQPKDVPLFATDNVANARKVADLLAEQIGPEGGEVALLRFNPGSQTDQERRKGFLDGLKTRPKLKLVAEQNGNGNKADALRVTQDILSANPQLAGIFASDEGSTVGAAAALSQAGKAGEVKIVGWDTSPDDLRALEAGQVQALIAQNPFQMGVQSINAVVAMKREDAKPAGADTGSVVVTKKNLQSDEVQAVLAPSCD